jgi:glyoxylate/hydroxypyruvate reductase
MRLLIYKPSYLRLEREISALGSGLELMLMDETGGFQLDGRSVDPDQAPAHAAWMNADIWAGDHAREYSRAVLKSPDLKWVQSGAAGVDHPIFGQIVAKGARLTTSHGQAIGMSEYVLAGVLDHFQGGDKRRQAQAEHAWRRHSFREIMGTEWLVVGFGAIGQAVAERARSFGARITGVRRSGAPHPAADVMAGLADLPGLLPAADVVVLSVPLTPETRHICDRAFLAAMKPGSVLVNVGRGGLVDEPALLAALDRGLPEHAVLDVFETEPLPADSPFWDHPRVALTPHASGMAPGQNMRNDRLFLENLRRFLAAEPLLGEVSAADIQTMSLMSPA